MQAFTRFWKKINTLDSHRKMAARVSLGFFVAMEIVEIIQAYETLRTHGLDVTNLLNKNVSWRRNENSITLNQVGLVGKDPAMGEALVTFCRFPYRNLWIDQKVTKVKRSPTRLVLTMSPKMKGRICNNR